ncbi:uncharacterized protein MYCFIDRAFT_170557 [Pseudocercospora fijiensis CIRAD86]|uniref:Uncharacterized protein n=1 Tax=Pseudocercospora fijiensis (strain CIRAD86) TaxID=383855 RepID=N1QAR4_PSEFD|nr:uncharacterized protein MYCFIDRAFT_170557 [Pseudocercospora fijiensis CIRAD86]EME89021.1 hypothetical protein MYCFIDRAFT_170557 [Pseudocercospora fijiensis CIRAD86]
MLSHISCSYLCITFGLNKSVGKVPSDSAEMARAIAHRSAHMAFISRQVEERKNELDRSHTQPKEPINDRSTDRDFQFQHDSSSPAQPLENFAIRSRPKLKLSRLPAQSSTLRLSEMADGGDP